MGGRREKLPRRAMALMGSLRFAYSINWQIGSPFPGFGGGGSDDPRVDEGGKKGKS
jgi:hypothetical protein